MAYFGGDESVGTVPKWTNLRIVAGKFVQAEKITGKSAKLLCKEVYTQATIMSKYIETLLKDLKNNDKQLSNALMSSLIDIHNECNHFIKNVDKSIASSKSNKSKLRHEAIYRTEGEEDKLDESEQNYMTVEELIKELQKIKDKKLPIVIDSDRIVDGLGEAGDEHELKDLADKIGLTVEVDDLSTTYGCIGIGGPAVSFV